MHTPDAIPHPNRIQHIRATHYASKNCVDAVQVRLGGMGDEVLTPAGVRTRQRHPDRADVVTHGIDLVAEHEPCPRTAPAVPARVAVLDHEIRDDAMPPRAIE